MGLPLNLVPFQPLPLAASPAERRAAFLEHTERLVAANPGHAARIEQGALRALAKIGHRQSQIGHLPPPRP